MAAFNRPDCQEAGCGVPAEAPSDESIWVSWVRNTMPTPCHKPCATGWGASSLSAVSMVT